MHCIVLLFIVEAWRIRAIENPDARAPISLKLPCNCYRARKQFLRLSNTVFSLVRLAMWLLRTNQSTVLPWRRQCFRALGNNVFLLVRLIMWLPRTNRSTVLLRRRNCFLAPITATWEFWWYRCASGFWNARILQASTINERTMICTLDSIT